LHFELSHLTSTCYY
jgi:serine/threonine-protein kinase ULK/ATG1